jgi:tripartite-type tricarboxylate transporter receptor subunit TctC
MFKRILVVASAAILVASPASAEWKPTGPIKMMIGFTAGGAADTQARLIAEELQSRKGWKVIPETVLGKGGAVLAAKMKKEPADGTSIGMIVSETVGYTMISDRNPGYTEGDFTYLATTAGTQLGVVATAGKGWKTLADAVKESKAGKKLTFGVMTPSLADGAYLLGKAQGVDFNIVNFKGGKGVLDAIVAGDIDMGWVAGPQGRAVAAGELVNLASGERSRLDMSPDAPTIKELGFAQDLGLYFMFVAPKGLSPEARSALSAAIVDIVNDPNSKTHAYIAKLFDKPTVISGAALDSCVADSLAGAKAMFKEANSK